jgi:hypothetical protein
LTVLLKNENSFYSKEHVYISLKYNMYILGIYALLWMKEVVFSPSNDSTSTGKCENQLNVCVIIVLVMWTGLRH